MTRNSERAASEMSIDDRFRIATEKRFKEAVKKCLDAKTDEDREAAAKELEHYRMILMLEIGMSKQEVCELVNQS